jgi:hypothetical protein
MLQSNRLSAHASLLPSLPPLVVNAAFIFVLLFVGRRWSAIPRCVLNYLCLAQATGAMSGVTGLATVKFNRGIDAWEALDKAIAAASITNAGRSGDATTVLSAIPNADELVQQMSAAFWNFGIPYWICMAFAVSVKRSFRPFSQADCVVLYSVPCGGSKSSGLSRGRHCI